MLRLADFLPGDLGPWVLEDFCVSAPPGPNNGEQDFNAQSPPSSREQHEACEQFSDSDNVGSFAYSPASPMEESATDVRIPPSACLEERVVDMTCRYKRVVSTISHKTLFLACLIIHLCKNPQADKPPGPGPYFNGACAFDVGETVLPDCMFPRVSPPCGGALEC